MYFFAHPGHDHSTAATAQTGLDATSLILLAATGIVVIGAVVAMIVISQTKQRKAAPKQPGQ